MPTYLVPAEEGRPIVLDKAIILVGRHPDCDVVLRRSRKVSRKHCCLAQVNEHFVIRDLGSMNGVQVNGQRVQSDAPFRIGDEVTIGDIRYIVTERVTEPVRPESPADHGQDTAQFTGPASNVLSQEYPVPIPEQDDAPVSAAFLSKTPEVELPFLGGAADSSAKSHQKDAPVHPSNGKTNDSSDAIVLDRYSDEYEDPKEFRDSGSHVELLPD